MTRMIGPRRSPRRRWTLLAILGALVAGGVLAATALALVSDTGTYSVIVANKNNSSGPVTLTPGGAIVEYIGSSANNQSSGTGIFQPFVRLQGSPTEAGYNTDGTVQFDTKVGTWTHSIKANAIPVVDCDGPGPGTAQCWELFVDINENNSTPYISLTRVQIWLTTNPSLVGYNQATHTFPSGASQVYDFSGEIKINDVNQGSGRGDLRYLVPIASIPFTSSDYFVLYSEWGSPDAAPSGTFASDGGFEEWKVRTVPNVGIVKTANPVGPVNAGSNIGFDINVSNTGAADATSVTISDPLPAGGDLNWSLNPAFTGCSITGAVGAQTLNCSFATLAAGGTIGPIHLTSATTAADCAVVSNTATVASGNDGGGPSTATVTVNCGALLIRKESTKTGNPLVSTSGASFCYRTATGCTAVTGTNVTDEGTGDELKGTGNVGLVCVSGLAPGAYKVNETGAPTGYGASTSGEQTATVVNGTDCGSHLPSLANTAVFTDPPLGSIGVTFTDGGSGETHASIVCKQGTTTIGADSENGAADPAFDDTNESFSKLAPGTYDCQVVIDP
jgi:uncharacterized repeat protein (TIGR01451 family)